MMKLVQKDGPQSKMLVLRKESREEDKKSVSENGRQGTVCKMQLKENILRMGMKEPNGASAKPKFGAHMIEEMITLTKPGTWG